MGERILVINPNSTEKVTQGIAEAMAPLRLDGGPEIECVGLEQGPPGIENEGHVAQVTTLIAERIRARDNDCAGFVIACYSDPGIALARETTKKPVLGIAECGMLTAMTLGQKFGVIAILDRSIPRHLRYIGSLGWTDRLAGERAIGLGVTELSDEGRTLTRMIDTAKLLRDQDRADVIVMGCAGMARYRDRVEQAVGLPVVEPTQAAVGMAIGRVRLGWRTRAQMAA
ncbi:MAG: Asp/Glu racemase [Alphaproteobacteria bacterium]|nr:Asp/Glu racemase [Alphaproteobacteria bacterium]